MAPKTPSTPLEKYHQIKLGITLLCLIEIGLFSASIAKGPPSTRPYAIWGVMLSFLTIFYQSFLRRVCDIPSASSASKNATVSNNSTTEGSEGDRLDGAEGDRLNEGSEGEEMKQVQEKKKKRYNQPAWAIYALHILPIGLWISAPCIPILILVYSGTNSRYSRRWAGRLGSTVAGNVYDLGPTKAAASMAFVIGIMFLIEIPYLYKIRREQARERKQPEQSEILR